MSDKKPRFDAGTIGSVYVLRHKIKTIGHDWAFKSSRYARCKRCGIIISFNAIGKCPAILGTWCDRGVVGDQD